VTLPNVSDWIEAALEGTGWTVDEVYDGAADGAFRIFTHPRAVMVSEVIQSPRHRVMHVWAAGGYLDGIEALLPEVEAWGRVMGCDAGGATGRKGWVRYLAKHGYRPAQCAVEKEL
jgi:hypothetical protein